MRIFERFANGSGVLDVKAMNCLQKAVGNSSKYTGTQYRALCTAVGAEWVPTLVPGRSNVLSHGLTAAGLETLYRHMGIDALARDLEVLGIPPESASEQLQQLRRTMDHLQALEQRVRGANAQQQELEDKLHASQSKQEALSAQVATERARNKELETLTAVLHKRAVAAEADMQQARAVEAASTSVVDDLRAQLQAAQDGLKQVYALLEERVDEKNELQRALWSLQQQHDRYIATLRRSQVEVFKASQAKRQAAKVSRQMYMRLHAPRNTHTGVAVAVAVDGGGGGVSPPVSSPPVSSPSPRKLTFPVAGSPTMGFKVARDKQRTPAVL